MERESIKAITERVRKEREQVILNGGTEAATIQPEPQTVKPFDGEASTIAPPISVKPPPVILTDGQDLAELIQQITSVKVSGQTKMLIRFDDKHMPVLNMLQPALKINVVQFVNFLVERFFETNPDIKTLMKNSLKNSLKEI
ncbi:hypothetical protein ABDD95_23900 (plasmid) [Mucilaginibacter sp. PAMB04274]|uniref:hypothetical protein n=1 Tax=Mucilaginibacter sp. PAMB04274 TaxID=3138568 RepID=UPI0012125C4C|nr:MAG: hypothetical protein EOO85_20445 [Pedobacter sp.]